MMQHNDAGRGITICSSQFFQSDWQKIQEIQAIAMLVLGLASRFIHESPRYLAARGRTDEAPVIHDDKRRNKTRGRRDKC